MQGWHCNGPKRPKMKFVQKWRTPTKHFKEFQLSVFGNEIRTDKTDRHVPFVMFSFNALPS
jgi:hypothetical protein